VPPKHSLQRPPAPHVSYKTKAAALAHYNTIFFSRHQRTPNNTAAMFNLILAALLQLSMFLLVEAAPLTVQSAKPWQAGTGGGIVGFIVLVLDIIAWSKTIPPLPL
jgi:hypothetical protein